MRRILLSVVLVLVALVLQLTVLDRLRLPGGAVPDLVLLVVVALALSNGPLPGMLTGFAAGLALDIAPPSTHLIGVYALVFCLVGYFCGRVAADLESTVLLPLAASAVGAAGGAALYAGLGILLGDPDVTGQAVRHMLPATVLYDVLLSPFVLYAVALASKLAGNARARFARPVLAGGGGPAPRSGAAAIPRDAWIGSGWLAASAELARSRPVPQLHLGGKRGGSGPIAGRAAGPQRAAGGKNLARLRFSTGRRGDGVVGSRLLDAVTGLAGSGLSMPRSSGTRRGLGDGAPRRGSFRTNAKRKAAASAATPRRGTFGAPPQRKRMPATGSPRRGSFSGGSSTRGTFGAGAPRRGAFVSARRFRALRRSGLQTRRGFSGKRGFSGGRSSWGRGALGRVRGGRSAGLRSSGSWRARYKRNGG